MTRLTLLLVPLACLLAACSDARQAALTVSGLRVSEPRPGTTTGAAYLELENSGAEPVTLTAVTSPQYELVEIHQSVVEDGVARMRRIPELVIAPGETLQFAPGGLHLMLMRPRVKAVPVTLEFWSHDVPLLVVEAADDGG